MPNGDTSRIRGLPPWIIQTSNNQYYIKGTPDFSRGFFYTFVFDISMGRIIGIDYGTKRIGIAVTDPLNIIASPLTTVSNVAFDAFLEDYTKKENIEAFVIGYPKQMDNTPSQTVRYIDPFVKKMKKRFPDIAIFLVDERFTSIIAMKSIIDGGAKKSDRQNKSLTDKVSAALILQSYIDSGIAIKKI